MVDNVSLSSGKETNSMSFGESISSEAFVQIDVKKDIFSIAVYGSVRYYVYKIPGKNQLDLQISCMMQIHYCLYLRHLFLS